jgi:hypothetical protein
MAEVLSSNLENYWTQTTIRKDFSPAEWTCKKPTYHELTEVTLSFGGGMGGSRRTLYIQETRDMLTPHSLVEVMNFLTGEVETINTDFMVYAKDVVIAEITYKTSNKHIIETYNCDRLGHGTIYKKIRHELMGRLVLTD